MLKKWSAISWVILGSLSFSTLGMANDQPIVRDGDRGDSLHELDRDRDRDHDRDFEYRIERKIQEMDEKIERLEHQNGELHENIERLNEKVEQLEHDRH